MVASLAIDTTDSGPTSDEAGSDKLHRFEVRTEYDEPTVQRQSTDRRSHGVRVRRRRQNDLGATEPL